MPSSWSSSTLEHNPKNPSGSIMVTSKVLLTMPLQYVPTAMAMAAQTIPLDPKGSSVNPSATANQFLPRGDQVLFTSFAPETIRENGNPDVIHLTDTEELLDYGVLPVVNGTTTHAQQRKRSTNDQETTLQRHNLSKRTIGILAPKIHNLSPITRIPVNPTKEPLSILSGSSSITRLRSESTSKKRSHPVGSNDKYNIITNNNNNTALSNISPVDIVVVNNTLQQRDALSPPPTTNHVAPDQPPQNPNLTTNEKKTTNFPAENDSQEHPLRVVPMKKRKIHTPPLSPNGQQLEELALEDQVTLEPKNSSSNTVPTLFIMPQTSSSEIPVVPHLETHALQFASLAPKKSIATEKTLTPKKKKDNQNREGNNDHG